MHTDGFFRSQSSSANESVEWLRFYDNGTVAHARSGPRVETLSLWFGTGDGFFADAVGTYAITGNQLQVQLGSQHWTGSLRDTVLHLGDQRFDFVAAPSSLGALPFPFQPSPKEVVVPTNLPAVDLAWWNFAVGRGWHCRRCDRVPTRAERECWLDTGFCTECAIEAFR